LEFCIQQRKLKIQTHASSSFLFELYSNYYYFELVLLADAANNSIVVCFYLQMLHTNYKANVYELETALGIDPATVAKETG